MIAIALAAVIITIAAISIFVVVQYAIDNSGDITLSFSDMTEMMRGNRMQMQAARDVAISLESESEVPAGKQTRVVLKVIDQQTNTSMQDAEVIVGIEKGLPMTTMDMMNSGGMFSAEEKGNGIYTFTFTPESDGYYTVHAHAIPPGERMHSMMENHADFLIVSK